MSPVTVQVRVVPIAVPATGVVQLPLVADVAEPHDTGLTA